MNYWRIATFNTAGMADPTWRSLMFTFFRSLNVHIICLQETHSRSEDETNWTNEWGLGQACFNSDKPGKSRKKGVAILLNDPVLSMHVLAKSTDGRVVSAEVQYLNTCLRIVNVYCPTMSYSATCRNNFFDSLYLHFQTKHPTILTGDFNVVDNPLIDKNPPGNFNDRSNSLLCLCNTAGLTDTFRTLYGNAPYFTRRQGVSQSRLDRFYVTSNVKRVHEFAVPSTFSDHDVISLEIESYTTVLRGPGFWKNNTSIYDTQEFLDTLTNRWKLWETLELTLFSNKVDWWLHIKDKLQLLCKYCCKTVNQAVRSEENKMQQNLHRMWQRLSTEPYLTSTYQQQKKELATFQKEQARKIFLKSQTSLYTNSDHGTKAFYQQFATPQEHTHVQQLVDSNGNLYSKQENNNS